MQFAYSKSHAFVYDLVFIVCCATYINLIFSYFGTTGLITSTYNLVMLLRLSSAPILNFV